MLKHRVAVELLLSLNRLYCKVLALLYKQMQSPIRQPRLLTKRLAVREATFMSTRRISSWATRSIKMSVSRPKVAMEATEALVELYISLVGSTSLMNKYQQQVVLRLTDLKSIVAAVMVLPARFTTKQ